MLTDIAVEHYKWVAGGDKQHPDPTTATDRANLFLDRLGLLFDEGMVLTMPDTYTASVMQFLQKGKLFQVRGRSLCVGLGDPADPEVKKHCGGSFEEGTKDYRQHPCLHERLQEPQKLAA